MATGRSKQGSFFLIDAFIGLSILVLAVVIINNFEVQEPSTSQSFTLLNDYVDILVSTEIRDFSDPFADELVRTGLAPIEDEPLFMVVARLHNQGLGEHARNLTNRTAWGIIPSKNGISYKVDGNVIYEKASLPLDEASFVLTNRQMTVVRIDESTIYGPVLTEVVLWQ